jgi:hypothetical protein
MEEFLTELESNILKEEDRDLVSETVRTVFHYIFKTIKVEMKYADMMMAKAMDK